MGKTKEQLKITVADNLSCLALLLPRAMCWLGFAATLLILTSKGVGAEGTKKEYRWETDASYGTRIETIGIEGCVFRSSTYKEFECAQGDHISTHVEIDLSQVDSISARSFKGESDRYLYFIDLDKDPSLWLSLLLTFNLPTPEIDQKIRVTYCGRPEEHKSWSALSHTFSVPQFLWGEMSSYLMDHLVNNCKGS